MGNPAGVRRDFRALEQRRLRAARLLKRGVHQSEVARQVGAHRQSVSRWAQQLEAAPGRVSVVALETARVAELLPHYFRAVESLRTPGASSYAQTAYSGDRLLAAGQPVPAVTILCNNQ